LRDPKQSAKGVARTSENSETDRAALRFARTKKEARMNSAP
jgi:hypothetical protein